MVTPLNSFGMGFGETYNMNIQPTIFHITHHKAGSQWVAEVLKYCALERVVLPQPLAAHFYEAPIKPGGVYLTVYISKQEFEKVMASVQHPYRKLIIIRDLRDTLVSLYFSWKFSHVDKLPWLSKGREILNNVDQEQGLLYLIGKKRKQKFSEKFNLLYLKHNYEFGNIFGELAWQSLMSTAVDYLANIQLSWLTDDEVLLVRYEDLVADEHVVFERIIDYCQIKVDRQYLHNVVKYNSFEVVTGRKRGQEDVNAHQRKGIIGDWRNHFSDRVKDEFKKRFGEVLIKTGYEHDLNW